MTARIALVTDSTADLPAELVTERQLYIAPLHVLWGHDVLRDGVDITVHQFYERLEVEPELPTTSQPSPAEFADIYQRARDEQNAEAVLTMTISADLSGTYSSALQAAEMVDFPVHVVDLRTATIATGLGVLHVADARDAGASIEAMVTLAQSLATRTKLVFTLETLKYLHKGGRIGGGRRLLGTALNIKPLLTVENGKVEALESVRTRKRALQRLIEIAAETLDANKPLHVSILHGRTLDEAEMLKEEFTRRFAPDTILIAEIGATIGVHVGPGAVGYTFLQ